MGVVMSCVHCGSSLSSTRRIYCDGRCRQRAYRRRQGGVSQQAYPNGAKRGRVPLGQHTRAEILDALLSARPPL
jgi:hypothetical protein